MKQNPLNKVLGVEKRRRRDRQSSPFLPTLGSNDDRIRLHPSHLENYRKLGLGGAHTDSNQRLM
jgi:hypothetical protein